MPSRILALLLLPALAGMYVACGDKPSSPSPAAPSPQPPPVGSTAVGLWISAPELAGLPESGAGWANVFNQAQQGCRPPRLSDQEDQGDVCLMSKALVYVRTGENGYRDQVMAALDAIVAGGTYRGRALALGRQLPAIVVAADLIDLPRVNPDLNTRFSAFIRNLLHTPTFGGPVDLVDCHEKRPNNWGNHCGAARAAVAAYLHDSGEMARTAQVFRGFLGDRNSYAGFEYGELDWQCDPSQPVGINRTGCTKDGHVIDGVIPDDQRRSGGFAWPPPRENYVYESLQGTIVQAAILDRAGYPAFTWQDRAVLRAFRWLQDQASYPAAGDDEWQMHVVNFFYRANLPAPIPARPGKNMGFTDWTHRR
jgi:hypothetical protein